MPGKPLSNGDLLVHLRELLFNWRKSDIIREQYLRKPGSYQGNSCTKPSGVRRELIDTELYHDSLFRTVLPEEIDESPEIDIIVLFDDEDGTFTGLTPIINLKPMGN
jgi:hypothetical protein